MIQKENVRDFFGVRRFTAAFVSLNRYPGLRPGLEETALQAEDSDRMPQAENTASFQNSCADSFSGRQLPPIR